MLKEIFEFLTKSCSFFWIYYILRVKKYMYMIFILHIIYNSKFAYYLNMFYFKYMFVFLKKISSQIIVI